MKLKSLILLLMTSLLCLYGCKPGFLDVKPQKSLLVPTTTADLWALLDNNQVFNNTPGLPAEADGDLYTTDLAYNQFLLDEERQNYIWAQNLFGSNSEGDWNVPYQQIFYTNVVLEAAAKLNAGSGADANVIKGTALFHRAFAFYHLLQQFAPPYRAASAATDLGVPLRLSSDLTRVFPRASVASCYAQVLDDLKTARRLLPSSSSYKTRPVTAAAFGMLARVYLAMEDYPQAGKYADSCLQLNPALINYNTLSATATRPFSKALPNSNDEIIFYAVSLNYSNTSSSFPLVADPALYQSYAANDLRKVIFYKSLAPGFKFKGNYAGIISLFSGLASDEVYLIRAECAAHSGDAAAALSDLNTLLAKRWKTGSYVNQTAATADAALALVLNERRKELVARGTRWADLRRLNKDSRFAVTLNRTIAGVNYTLAPDSKRYTYPIPLDELRINPVPQNDR